MTPSLLPPCLATLRSLFPDADPGFLSQAILHHLEALSCLDDDEDDNKVVFRRWSESDRRNREAVDEVCRHTVVERVVQKMLEDGGEAWPRVKLKLRRSSGAGVRLQEQAGMVGKGKERGVGVLQGKMGAKKAAQLLSQHEAEPGAVDETLTRNIALVRLHSIFPSTPIPTLRQLLLSFPHSYLLQTIEHLLANPDLANPLPPPPSPKQNTALDFLLAPFRSRSRTPSASSSETGDEGPPSLPALLPSDLLRSTSYIPYLTSHLQRTFPSVPASVLKSFMADEVPYRELRWC
ncbi:hypothetical protein BCR35DRAFT_31490 [Leucosporidium creatinivorum]|uniref:Uncharacterized protein n=1 Tax=Leucosporidium creatinivorum TaxID=106004 RepID=A0A1Y2FVR6_9BASI|nr:hypothetical protein BCR35DRAFT_31490 [Leucosporidium creatinivorum]